MYFILQFCTWIMIFLVIGKAGISYRSRLYWLLVFLIFLYGGFHYSEGKAQGKMDALKQAYEICKKSSSECGGK